MNRTRAFFRWLSNERFWGYGLFWSWNVIFLAFMLFGFAPHVLPDTLQSVRDGVIPTAFLVYAIVLTLIPILAAILGALILRRSPGKLLALGYGVEGPLMVMLALRFFIFRDTNPAIKMLLIVGSLAIITLLWQILDTKLDQRRLVFSYLRVAGLTLTLLVGLYAGVVVAFFAVPLTAALPNLFKNILSEMWNMLTHWRSRDIAALLFSFFGSLLAIYTATLVVAMPIAVPAIYIRNWWRGLRSTSSRQGWLRPVLLVVCISAITTILFIQTNQQPQHKAYALLKTPPETPEQAHALQKSQTTLRLGLLNAYLSPLRYLSVAGQSGMIMELYQWSLKLPSDTAAQVENLYEVVIRPALYELMSPANQGDDLNQRWEGSSMQADTAKAAQLYEDYFDVPIIQGERKAILRAVRSTWSSEQALTGWQSVDDREVLLAEQAIQIKEHGDWAEVELYEVYLNQTYNRQEVVYYFSLPESAVITGIWLGTSADREQRSAFQVAPRGAAQALYRSEINYRRDPALIEQIGPQQYRLRIFPVEPKVWIPRDAAPTEENGPSLHFWMTYSVLASAILDGKFGWRMPHLAEKRNVYWDETTIRSINGQPITTVSLEWLPASIAASNPVTPAIHRVDFPSGETVVISPSLDWTPTVPQDRLNLALVLDRSGSMANHSKAVQEALGTLAAYSANVDVYLTSSIYRGESPSRVNLIALSDKSLSYVGGQNAAELIQQFFTLYKGEKYDGLFILTDGSGFKLGRQTISMTAPDMPVWIVHLDGKMPLGYDDTTLEIIQASQGGVAEDINEALTRLTFDLQLDRSVSTESTTDWVDGYEWTVSSKGQIVSPDNTISHSNEDPFAAIAARRLILDAMYRQRGQLTQISTLDELHAIAVAQNIVTPYSSMIVLTNMFQQQRLGQLEEQADRYQREAETVGETSTAAPFQVTGVPEPHEWLLLILTAGMLGWYIFRRNK